MKLLIVLLLSFGFVNAQEYTIDKKMDECLENAGPGAPDAECYGTAMDEWDKELNRVYKELMKELKSKVSEDASKQLKESQRDWIKYKDKELQFAQTLFEEIVMGNTDSHYMYIQISLLKNRAIELQNYLDQIN